MVMTEFCCVLYPGVLEGKKTLYAIDIPSSSLLEPFSQSSLCPVPNRAFGVSVVY